MDLDFFSETTRGVVIKRDGVYLWVPPGVCKYIQPFIGKEPWWGQHSWKKAKDFDVDSMKSAVKSAAHHLSKIPGITVDPVVVMASSKDAGDSIESASMKADLVFNGQKILTFRVSVSKRGLMELDTTTVWDEVESLDS